jgi:glycosyltransferase involved in cell wall biosynthesis
MAKQLGVSNYQLVPLGADPISKKAKSFDDFKLIYVGTFFNRRIEDTIEGLALFLKKRPIDSITYDIIGFGPTKDIIKIKSALASYGLESVVNLHARKTHQELITFFDNCNVGISYVPITPYFNHQPVSKIFEYIQSGLICLATNTYESQKVINDQNGMLCDDNPQSFCNGLEHLYENRTKYNFNEIKNSLADFSWENIVLNYLKPYLENILIRDL